MAIRRKKVLIVDDEKSVARAMASKISGAGFDIKIVNDGVAALAELDHEHYDLMFLDMIMPDLDGFHVLEAVKARGIDIKIIITSHLAQDEDMNRAKLFGVVDYFVKFKTPVKDIVDKVKTYI